MMRETVGKVLLAIGLIILAYGVGKFFESLIFRITRFFSRTETRTVKKISRITKTSLFLIALVTAMWVIDPSLPWLQWSSFFSFFESLLLLLLIWVVGYMIIDVIFHFIYKFYSRWAEAIMGDIDIPEEGSRMIFGLLKLFSFLLVAVVSLRVLDASIFVIEIFVIGMGVALLCLLAFFVGYSFKDYFANLLLSVYVGRSLLKPGQHIKIDGIEGEVSDVNSRGVVVDLENNYKYLVPNTAILKKNIFFRRTRSDMDKLQSIVSHHIVQLPSHCGPAALSMLLKFFGYNVGQEKLAKLSNLKIRPKKHATEWSKDYGTVPEDLLKAVKKATNNEVIGSLVSYDEIYDLKEELKVWFSEGALVILWYKKPVLFPNKKSRSGHFVLGVGVEEEDILVMDTSSQTAGVFLVKPEIMESAMAEYDKTRGYVVFGKKGSPAYWRIKNGYTSIDTEIYTEISKNVEKYLKKKFRNNKVLNTVMSPIVEIFLDPETKIQKVWEPPDLEEKKKNSEKKRPK